MCCKPAKTRTGSCRFLFFYAISYILIKLIVKNSKVSNDLLQAKISISNKTKNFRLWSVFKPLELSSAFNGKHPIPIGRFVTIERHPCY